VRAQIAATPLLYPKEWTAEGFAFDTQLRYQRFLGLKYDSSTKMNQAFFFDTLLMKALNTLLFITTSSLAASKDLIWGFLQEYQRNFFRIHLISHWSSERSFFSLWRSIVSLMIFVVTTFPSKSFMAYLTASIFSCSMIAWRLAFYFRHSSFSSAFMTYCVINWLIFSGLIENNQPISFGFLYS